MRPKFDPVVPEILILQVFCIVGSKVTIEVEPHIALDVPEPETKFLLIQLAHDEAIESLDIEFSEDIGHGQIAVD